MIKLDLPQRQQFEAMLPATSVTPEMRQKVAMIAQCNNTSIAEVVRIAITLFLSESANIVSESDNGEIAS